MATGLVINFYKFVELSTLQADQQRLTDYCQEVGLLGTILIASEGINGSLYGSPTQIQMFKDWLRSDHRFNDMIFKDSEASKAPFKKLSVKIKAAILSFNTPVQLPVEAINNGPRISPHEFRNAILNPSPDTVIVDTRNKYEVDYGTFRGAEHLGIRSFKNFAADFAAKYGDQRDKTFLMFCTGGIRCEKAVAALQQSGFENVKQLDGGIIKYFEDCGGDGFEGSCFVFDNRWAINPDLGESNAGPHPEQIPRRFSQI